MSNSPDDRTGPEKGLCAVDISRNFGAVKALEQVNLTLRPGTIHGLIGPNGAGKSTLVNILTGYDTATNGTVTIDGEVISKTPAHRRAHLGLARTFQHGRLYDGLTARENVEISALGTGATAAEARDLGSELLELMGLGDQAERAAGTLPHGSARKLGVARALATQPRYLLLDEPAAGLNEGEIVDFVESIRAVRDRGVGTLLIDHNMKLIFALCADIHVLVHGKSFFEGSPQEIREHPEVQAAYLGRTAAA